MSAGSTETRKYSTAQDAKQAIDRRFKVSGYLKQGLIYFSAGMGVLFGYAEATHHPDLVNTAVFLTIGATAVSFVEEPITGMVIGNVAERFEKDKLALEDEPNGFTKQLTTKSHLSINTVSAAIGGAIYENMRLEGASAASWGVLAIAAFATTQSHLERRRSVVNMVIETERKIDEIDALPASGEPIYDWRRQGDFV